MGQFAGVPRPLDRPLGVGLRRLTSDETGMHASKKYSILSVAKKLYLRQNGVRNRFHTPTFSIFGRPCGRWVMKDGSWGRLTSFHPSIRT